MSEALIRRVMEELGDPSGAGPTAALTLPARGTDGQVARRKVFYIPGYDPFHPRRYRELYRKEGAIQAMLCGYSLGLAPRQGGGRYGWHVSAQVGTHRTETDVEVLVWSDLVRESMDQGILATYLQLLRTAWIYLSSGALFRLMRLRKGPVIAALYPVAMLLGQLALAAVPAILTTRAGVALLPAPMGFLLGLLPGLILAWALMRWFKAQDHRLFAQYLMHDYAFTAALRGANPPVLEARMAEFRRAIAAALDEPVEEVLVVGHSSGAHLAVSILADLLRSGLPKNHPELSFLSLGQVVPMVSFLPEASRLRADLHDLSRSEAVTWIDVTAPGDGCAFALCDPVAVSGVAPADKRWPLVLSAAFTQTLSAQRWRALRWRFFRLHFQYLCAFDRLPGTPGDYDYFRITAGPQTLAARLGGRAPSRSRIDVAASGYTSRS